MSDKLVIVESRYVFRLQWELDDGDDLGAVLCADKSDGKGEPPAERGNWEHWEACRIARTSAFVEFDAVGAFWDSKSAATAALRIIRVALKQERPLPEWATAALEHGWKPPKNWRA